jgi:hypothetical protein
MTYRVAISHLSVTTSTNNDGLCKKRVELTSVSILLLGELMVDVT